MLSTKTEKNFASDQSVETSSDHFIWESDWSLLQYSQKYWFV